MSDIGEVKAAVARAGEDLPLLLLQDVANVLEGQRSRLAEALTGTTNDDARTALGLLTTAGEAIRRAIESHQAARAQCEEYVSFA